MNIPFNRIWLTGKEEIYQAEVLASGHLSGNGIFTQRCIGFFRTNYKIPFPFLTHSCTGALEMASLLLNVKPGDEIIFPSYTFVSTVNAFLLRGAVPVFADSLPTHPNIDPQSVSEKITSSTKGMVVVHYAGMACDMNALRKIATDHHLWLMEDAAQSVDAFYNDEPLGTIGDIGAYSFHDTKNVIAGEAGLLIVKNEELAKRAEIIGEKGTNRSAFLRNEVDEYGWKDLGSTFYPPETTAAILLAQLEHLHEISQLRKTNWDLYNELFASLKGEGNPEFPVVENYMKHNGMHFFLTCENATQRNNLLQHLKEKGIVAASHFRPLHLSDYYQQLNPGRVSLPNAERYGNGLVRLPLYTGMKREEIAYVAEAVCSFRYR